MMTAAKCESLFVWAMDDFGCRWLVEAPSHLFPQANAVPEVPP